MAAQVYTLPEAAEYLRVSTKWLRSRCQEGAPHIRMAEKYLFTERHLEKLLASYEATPKLSAPSMPRSRKSDLEPMGDVVELRAKVPYRLRNA